MNGEQTGKCDMSTDPATIVLGDGHTTVKHALELANEMHDLAEERAEETDDEAAGLLSEGAAVIEMLAAKLAEGICQAR